MKKVLLVIPFVLLGCRDGVTGPNDTAKLLNARARGSSAEACSSICYVDAVNGNDLNGGASTFSAKRTIQSALNAVAAGGQVRVMPGTYHESAPGSAPTSLGGTYQFGLFFGSAKPGITLLGVDASDAPITSATATQARIYTSATNNFGYDGIFVEAANTTIQGLEIGPNDPEDNKTIEVVADNFTLQYVKTSVGEWGGSIYINDFSAAGDVVKSYHIKNNAFLDGTSVDISSGAGLTGQPSGREITGNTFDLKGYDWNAISFNGSNTGVPWFTNSVGGAIISGNSFRNGSLQYIRARGTYENAQFAWAAYWSQNSFDHASVALVGQGGFDVRTYSYEGKYGTFNDVRRIGAALQPEIDNTIAGDALLARGGPFVEQVKIDHSLMVTGSGASSTTLVAPVDMPIATDPGSNIITIMGSSVVRVDFSGFTVSGPGGTSCGSIRTGIFVRDGAKAIIHGNRIVDIRDALSNDLLSGCQNGIGIAVGRNAWGMTGSAVITQNVITGFQKGGIVIDNAGSAATIDGNTILGVGATTRIAQNGIQISRGATATVTGNSISGINYSGPWDACGLLFYDAGGVAQHSNMFRDNNKNVCNAGRGGGKASATP